MIALRQRLAEWKERLGPLWKYGAAGFVLERAGDVMNMALGLFLVPAFVPRDDWGAILPALRMVTFACVPMAILSPAAAKYLNRYHVAGDVGRVKSLLLSLGLWAAALSVAATGFVFLGREFLQVRLKVADPRVLWALAAMTVMAYWHGGLMTAAQGLMKFRQILASSFLGSFLRFVLALWLLRVGQLLGYLTATILGGAFVSVCLFWSLRKSLWTGCASVSCRDHWSDMWRFTGAVGLVMAATELVMFTEAWAIRNFTPTADSAGFYVANVFGQIPLSLAGAVVPFLFPLVSQRFERKESTQSLLFQSVAVILVGGLFLTLVLAVSGRWILSLRPSWREVIEYAPFLWQISFLYVCQAVMTVFATHENACGKFGYVKVFAGVMALEAVLLYGLMGWGFFRPYLPAGFWAAVEGLVSRRLGFVMGFVMAQRFLLAAYALAQVAAMRKAGVGRSGDGSSA